MLAACDGKLYGRPFTSGKGQNSPERKKLSRVMSRVPVDLEKRRSESPGNLQGFPERDSRRRLHIPCSKAYF
jgi:hypothetical protein